MYRFFILIVVILVVTGCASTSQSGVRHGRPNIVVIVSDDQGNADAGFQRSPSIVSTPSIDRLARDGVVFTNGYASAYVCAPTRAGLLTGRYQQRFGFYRAPDSRRGLPLSEITLADVLKAQGYRTGIFGKWHLGLTKEHHPCSRGFDEFYGFLGHGAHDYFDLTIKDSPDDFHQSIYRNYTQVSDTGYLTDNLAREACSFISRETKREHPFFLYLPFNAVHTPLQAPAEDINLFDSGDPKRDIQLAMLRRMDMAVGRVLETLKAEGIYQQTIIFFFSDNGGAKNNRSNNSPLRDFKHSVYEGGVRVPFIMSWPDKLMPAESDIPVISLDIMPTICSVLDIELPPEKTYDGKNILTALQGGANTPLHEHLFFDGNDDTWAVRAGKWKLLQTKKGVLELYDLEEDPSEQSNLADRFRGKVEDLRLTFREWRDEMGTPMSKKK